MKKVYRALSLLLLAPVFVSLSACYDHKPIIGYGYLKSLELVNNSGFQQPDDEHFGDALIVSKEPKWDILNSNYADLRFNTMTLGDARYSAAHNFTFVQWCALKWQLQMTVHFSQSDFNAPTWTWLSNVGEYKGDDGSLATIFAPRTPAHFQYGFRVYHEINQAQGIGPTPRAEQFLLRASSTVISSSTAILNPFLTLNIETDNDGVDWELSWVAPLNTFWSRGPFNLLNFEFKLLTESVDMSQIITPNGDVIGLKYPTAPINQYFTLINDYPGKNWS